jgi:hypothetical protein
MRYLCNALSCATIIAVAAAGTATAQAPGIFGTYNPATGQFLPTPVQAAPQSSASPTPYSPVARNGTVHVNLTITVLNGTPSTTTPSCYLYVYHQPPGHSYSQSQSITGTRTNNVAHCNIIVHYSWPAADTAYPVTFSATAYVGSSQSGVPIDPVSLPANGATTTINVATRV